MHIPRRMAEAYERGAPMAETIAHAVQRLHAEGLSADDVRALLQDLMIMPVFTAHPTEAKRRTMLFKLKTIAAILNDLDMVDLLPAEREEKIQQLRENIVLLWQSDEMRDRPPTVMDEVRNGLYFFENTLYDPCRASMRNWSGRWLRRTPARSLSCRRFCATAHG